MPLINLEYDDNEVSSVDAQILSQAIRGVVSEVTGIDDVFVYANTAKIKVQIAPIEIFVRMTTGKIGDLDILMKEIKSKLQEWKKQVNFTHPVNLTIIPMNWKVEIGI
jgi:hypothetical protein